MTKKKPNLPSSTDIRDSKIKDIQEKLILDLEKQHGKGVLFFGDHTIDTDIVPTGILGVDVSLGVGGIPRGRISEIYGPEGSGKTTISLSVIAEAQKRDLVCVFIDAENALDPMRAEQIGVDMERMFISQPDSGEQALEVTESLVRSGSVDVIVVDSVAALTPQAEIDGEMGASHVGLQARLMSQAMRKLMSVVKKHNVALIFTNQIREKVGVMYGSPEVTPGGRALKFAASIRLDVRFIGQIKDKTEVIGSNHRVKVKKNKVAAPFKEAEFEIIYDGRGISKVGQIIDFGVEYGFIKKAGSYYKLNDSDETLMGQGKEAARQYLIDNADVGIRLDRQVKQELRNLGKYRGSVDENDLIRELSMDDPVQET